MKLFNVKEFHDDSWLKILWFWPWNVIRISQYFKSVIKSFPVSNFRSLKTFWMLKFKPETSPKILFFPKANKQQDKTIARSSQPSNWESYVERFTYPSNSSVKGHIRWGADGLMLYSIESVSATFFFQNVKTIKSVFY